MHQNIEWRIYFENIHDHHENVSHQKCSYKYVRYKQNCTRIGFRAKKKKKNDMKEWKQNVLVVCPKSFFQDGRL